MWTVALIVTLPPGSTVARSRLVESVRPSAPGEGTSAPVADTLESIAMAGRGKSVSAPGRLAEESRRSLR